MVHEEEVYEDEDDENEEGNWRNDYPDEESDTDSDREERYGGMYLETCQLFSAADSTWTPVNLNKCLPFYLLLWWQDAKSYLVKPG